MATYDTHNIFAKILRCEIPCYKVYENRHTLAFLDIKPRSPRHTLDDRFHEICIMEPMG
jgi:histidine triad (HIT) family protein